MNQEIFLGYQSFVTEISDLFLGTGDYHHSPSPFFLVAKKIMMLSTSKTFSVFLDM